MAGVTLLRNLIESIVLNFTEKWAFWITRLLTVLSYPLQGGPDSHSTFAFFAVLTFISGTFNCKLPETNKRAMLQMIADVDDLPEGVQSIKESKKNSTQAWRVIYTVLVKLKHWQYWVKPTHPSTYVLAKYSCQYFVLCFKQLFLCHSGQVFSRCSICGWRTFASEFILEPQFSVLGVTLWSDYFSFLGIRFLRPISKCLTSPRCVKSATYFLYKSDFVSDFYTWGILHSIKVMFEQCSALLSWSGLM